MATKPFSVSVKAGAAEALTEALTEPMILRSMERCRMEIQAGINLPVAWSCLAFFHLLLNQSLPALESLTRVLTLCGKAPTDKRNAKQPCAASRVLRRTRETVRRLHSIREKLDGFDCFERLLTLALAILAKDSEALELLRSQSSWGTKTPLYNKTDSVVILSGACAPELQVAVDALRPTFARAVEGLSFVLLSGGTNAGISGVAGYVAAHSRGEIRAFGYSPMNTSRDAKGFLRVFRSNTRAFTPCDPLQGWTDLIAAGVDPHQVRVVGYAGGHISRVEYAVALAFGARVAVVDSPIIPGHRRFNDPFWKDHPNLLILPMDAMTIRAFLQTDGLELGAGGRVRFEKAAQMAHADYVKSARPKDPSLQDWEKLPESLKQSNYHQVIFWQKNLPKFGLGIRELKKKDREYHPLDMKEIVGSKGILQLAEMEHGRWNVERFVRGWRYAEFKEVDKKLNPCLVPWPELVDINGVNYQSYDVEAILGLPKKFREAGLEIYKL